MELTTGQAINMCKLIEELRSDEGDSVTILCDNPDYSGPNSRIEVNGEWTGWRDKTFTGSNVIEALRNAAAVKRVS